MSDTTTGIATQARVVTSADSAILILTGPDQTLTYQISATIEDVAGNAQSGDLYFVSRNPDIATVNSDGLVTAVSPGVAVIEVSTPTFGNDIAIFSDDGSPIVKIYARINVLVEPGEAIVPSFTLSGSDLSASASSGSVSTTITVTPSNGFTGFVFLSAFTGTDLFENNAQSVQSLATASNPGQVVGFPVIPADLTPITWNFQNAMVNVTDGPATFDLVLTWDGDAPPATGTYSFNIIGSVTPRWSITAPLAPDVSTLALSLTLS
jgi:Bacterial Ig-like domain (group 2)